MEPTYSNSISGGWWSSDKSVAFTFTAVGRGDCGQANDVIPYDFSSLRLLLQTTDGLAGFQPTFTFAVLSNMKEI